MSVRSKWAREGPALVATGGMSETFSARRRR
jgi:hypothetical protein